jgi:hypothetical protein
MAIFGIGAYYDNIDVSADFINNECACVGWGEDAAPPAHAILRHLRTGDIIFIKSYNPNVGLTIKAVGLVSDGKTSTFGDHLGTGVPVRWVWHGEERIGIIDDKWPVRTVTIYEEYHPEVQARVMDLLLGQRNNN